MKNYKKIKITGNTGLVKQVILVCLINFLTSGNVLCQENPWTTKPKGENPWSTEETKQIEKTTETTSETTTSKEVIETTSVVTATPNFGDSTSTSKETNTAALNSTTKERYFNINNTVVKLNKNSYNYFRSLKTEGKKLHKADGAIAAGVITGAFINLYALPVNLVASVVPTMKTMSLIEQFEAENPHATLQEVKAVKRGIRQKRIGKAVIGNLIGAAINIIAILVIFNI